MPANRPAPCVLTIAGSDSGAGAGAQADARTIHALGGFACMAITALTAQNTRGVRSWKSVSPAQIQAQITAVLGTTTDSVGALPVRVVKTGLLPGPGAVRAVIAALAAHPKLPLVVDPVIGSTSGTLFLNPAGVRLLCRALLPRATLVTPNWPEAEALTGIAIRSTAEAERAARALATTTGCAVLLKGGHAPGKICRDWLVMPNGEARWFESPRIRTANTHGTGCVLASAIATGLARGDTLVRAVTRARDFLQHSLRSHRAVHWGGAGPAFPG